MQLEYPNYRRLQIGLQWQNIKIIYKNLELKNLIKHMPKRCLNLNDDKIKQTNKC